ncbi:hypothetical protein GIB67_036933 [Kingdonia uniflora]|uniref:Uncharacterized protein n=1 Tax=Kingdonia uniflora TaxID=39325 RepID=A0A7J7NVN6_9MAGN|nr:hypothetical protein GIB67_036933 [Kingdonia uniflora]
MANSGASSNNSTPSTHPPITHLQHHSLNTHHHNSIHTSTTTHRNFNFNSNHRPHLRLPCRKGIPVMNNIKIYLHSLNRNLRHLACTINPIRSLNLKVFNLQITFKITYFMVNQLSTVKVTQMRQYLLKRRRPRKKKGKGGNKRAPAKQR